MHTSVPPEPLISSDVWAAAARRPSGSPRRAAATRRAQGAQRAQVAVAPGLQPRLPAGHQIRRRDPHHGRPVALGQPPLREQVRPRGSPSSITIEARSSSADTSAFHIIQAVVENHCSRPPGLQIPVEALVLVVLEQLAAVAVDDRLRQTGGAATRTGRTAGGRTATGSNSSGAGARQQLVPARRTRASDGVAIGHQTTCSSVGSTARGSPRLPRGGRRSGRGSRSHRRANSTLGSIWAKRSITLRAPNSGAQAAQIAPRLAVAMNAPASRGCWAGRRRRGHPGRRRAAAGRPAPGRPDRAARRTSARSAPASVNCATTAVRSRSSWRPTRCSA